MECAGSAGSGRLSDAVAIGDATNDIELLAEAFLALQIILKKGELPLKEVGILGLAIYQEGREFGPKTRTIKTKAAHLITYLEQMNQVSIRDGKIVATVPVTRVD